MKISSKRGVVKDAKCGSALIVCIIGVDVFWSLVGPPFQIPFITRGRNEVQGVGGSRSLIILGCVGHSFIPRIGDTVRRVILLFFLAPKEGMSTAISVLPLRPFLPRYKGVNALV